MAHGLRLQSVMAGRNGGQRYEAAGHIVFKVRKQRQMDVGTSLAFSFLCSPRPQSIERQCSHRECCFPTSLTSIPKLPQNTCPEFYLLDNCKSCRGFSQYFPLTRLYSSWNRRNFNKGSLRQGQQENWSLDHVCNFPLFV